MSVLLDTHVLLWALWEPDRLSVTARQLLADPRTDLLCSAVIPWEIAIKHRRGRLPDAGPVLAGFDAHLARLGARELPISSRHALVAGSLDWEHPDPFDRMLAAQALTEGLPLVTSDPAFSTLPGLRLAG